MKLGLGTGSAARVTRAAAGGNAFSSLGRQWAVRLTTFRRDGRPVSTPVNIAVDGDHVYFRTYEQAGKFKRLRNNPNVDVAPSTFRGEATGPATPARARLLTGADDVRAGRLIDQKHKVFQRLLVRTAHRLRGYTTRHFELLPPESPAR
jgi:PPOX class probable F420-dependent enzyme